MTHTFSLRALLSLSLAGLLVTACAADSDEPLGAQQASVQEVAAAPGACCEATPGVSGCADVTVQVCVCLTDAYCCLGEWDEACALEVEEFGCGSCPTGGGGSSGGGGSGGEGGAGGAGGQGGGTQVPGGACCSAGLPFRPTCDNPAIEACVCALTRDPFCCLVDWDDQCVSEVEEFGCGTCSSEE